MVTGKLVLEDGSVLPGESFGYEKSSAGEVVFNTSMVGYPEALTDPSYGGQILTLTYPLIGNYGVPDDSKQGNISKYFESDKIQITGLIVSNYSKNYSHWNATKSLSEWLKEHKVPALEIVDTRALTKKLREKGTMLGKMIFKKNINFHDPNSVNLAAAASVVEPIEYKAGKTRVVLIDCGVKNNIIRNLLARDITVVRVPWNYDFSKLDYDGLLISNGPGDPKACVATIENVKKAINKEIPIMGICLGNQILALASGADTYKLKYGHRSANQPVIDVDNEHRCYITSQNHGFAVNPRTLKSGWQEWFINANDNTNEGIKHKTKPFMSVQYHPEHTPGPDDTNFLFDEFKRLL